MHVNLFLIPFTKFNLTGDLSSIFRVFLYHHSMNKNHTITCIGMIKKKRFFGQTKKLIQFWEMVSNYNVNSSYTYKELKKCKNKWILCQKSKIYNKTFKILSIGKVFIKSTNSKMIFFISKIFGRLESTILWHTGKSSTKIVIHQYRKTKKNQHNYWIICHPSENIYN